MSKVRKVLRGIGWCILIVFVFLVMSIRAMDGCITFESVCIDFTDGNWQGTELPKETCRDEKSCDAYCQETYGVPMLWYTCCLTDGEVPDDSGHCINTQACSCDIGELS